MKEPRIPCVSLQLQAKLFDVATFQGDTQALAAPVLSMIHPYSLPIQQCWPCIVADQNQIQ